MRQPIVSKVQVRQCRRKMFADIQRQRLDFIMAHVQAAELGQIFLGESFEWKFLKFVVIERDVLQARESFNKPGRKLLKSIFIKSYFSYTFRPHMR